MNSRQQETNNNSNINCCPVLDWDQPLTDQELEAIDAIEASFQSSTPSSSSSSSTTVTASPSSSIIKKRHSSPQKDQEPPKNSTPVARFYFLSLQTFFSFSLSRVLKLKREKWIELSLVLILSGSPSFTKGVLPGKAAVMQICASNSLCHVMHIFHSGITRSLQFLLEDSTVVKAGIGIGGDRVKVFRDYNVSVKSVEDLSYLANQKLGGEPKTWGLQALTETLVCKESTCHVCIIRRVRDEQWIYPHQSFPNICVIIIAQRGLNLKQSFKSPTESDLETGKLMFYQKSSYNMLLLMLLLPGNYIKF
ncbi:hypothetical protein OIU85_007382 [Salix viminalis]|uniref:3'-5' exonuclease domain-containing protein n=1 Tax=Salix viminalis TaxID=40686 RepID=A0A9Q0SNN2_SALVM|nr:hypothetical protein OIU85_007382 [Salix viminalis]